MEKNSWKRFLWVNSAQKKRWKHVISKAKTKPTNTLSPLECQLSHVCLQNVRIGCWRSVLQMCWIYFAYPSVKCLKIGKKEKLGNIWKGRFVQECPSCQRMWRNETTYFFHCDVFNVRMSSSSDKSVTIASFMLISVVAIGITVTSCISSSSFVAGGPSSSSPASDLRVGLKFFLLEVCKMGRLDIMGCQQFSSFAQLS